MRIGINIRGLLTGKISGVEQYTLQTLKELLSIDKENHYILYYVSYKDYDQKLAQLLIDYPFLKGSNVEVKKFQWFNGPLFLHLAFKTLDWPKADLVCGGLDVMWMPSPELLPLSKKCARVTTFHDLIFMIFPETYTRYSRLWQWQMNYPYQAKISDRLIAVSKTTKRDMIRLLGSEPGKTSMIYEGVGPEYFDTVPSEILTGLTAKFNIGEKYLYYIGSLEPRKNLITIVRSLALLPDTIKLVISGSKSWLSEDFRSQIAQLGMEPRVIFTGRVSDVEKIAFMRGSLAFVFPSIYEGFGLMVLEAFAAGTPVITSNVSALPEVTGDAGILINPLDDKSLAAAVHKLDSDPIYRTQLITKGQAFAKNFTWNKSAQQTLKVIREAAQSHV